jgi:catechol 2,3-dioxygenase-like lactoylglutathione lyase family enzyme
MKRMHVGLVVEDVAASVSFYTRLLGAPPTLQKPDYAKWMLDDPCVNFSINSRGNAPGALHLGIQAEDETELGQLRARWTETGVETEDKNSLTCGYQTQNKTWVRDPEGIRWEAFHTYAVTENFGKSESSGYEEN